MPSQAYDYGSCSSWARVPPRATVKEQKELSVVLLRLPAWTEDRDCGFIEKDSYVSSEHRESCVIMWSRSSAGSVYQEALESSIEGSLDNDFVYALLSPVSLHSPQPLAPYPVHCGCCKKAPYHSCCREYVRLYLFTLHSISHALQQQWPGR